MLRTQALPLIAWLVTVGLPGCSGCCGGSDDAEAPIVPTGAVTAETSDGDSPTSQPTEELVRPEAEWVEDRVTAAQARLADEPAGPIVAAAIEAAGGLERWYANGPVRFRFRYAPIAGRDPIDTIQTVDTWRSRAVHNYTDNPSISFGWDGTQAWSLTGGAELGTNARFWALTPYYFIGVPFVLADEGVNLDWEGRLDLEGSSYDVVRATFDEGTGDAPDDYYVVLIDTETRRVGGVRYIVSYQGYFPTGGHTAEKIMFYDGSQTIEGIHLPMTFRTFRWGSTGDPGFEVLGPERVRLTDSTLSDVEFLPELGESAFEIPEDAERQEGY